MKYIKVIIDNVSDHTDTFYTYKCNDDEVKRGSVVKVPFGKGNRLKTAYVFDVRNENTDDIPDPYPQSEENTLPRILSVQSEGISHSLLSAFPHQYHRPRE